MIAEIIKKAMKARGIKQVSLAAHLGITPSNLSLFLNGKAGMQQDKIEAAFKHLGIILTIENYENR